MYCQKIIRRGFLFCVILGAFLHFAYDLSNQNPIFALFVPVNESVWEHLKMVYLPFLLYSIIGLMGYERIYPNFMTAYGLGALGAMVFIPLAFFSYTLLLGTHLLWLDILIFVLAVAIGSYIAGKILCSEQDLSPVNPLADNILGCFLFIIMIMAFTVFTTHPPAGVLFASPI